MSEELTWAYTIKVLREKAHKLENENEKLRTDKARLLTALKRLYEHGSILDEYDAENIIEEMEQGK